MSITGTPLLEIAKTYMKPELIEDNETNLTSVMKYVEDYFEQKSTKEQTMEFLSHYLKSIDSFEKLDVVYKTIKNQAFAPQEQRTYGVRTRSRPWSNDEDEKLKTAVEENGPNNWGAVASYVGNGRTRSQCSQRWNRVINPKISKANWTPEEEKKLLESVESYGVKAWTRVAAEFGNRSDVQCRFKYNFIMKKRGISQDSHDTIPSHYDEEESGLMGGPKNLIKDEDESNN